ncbi:uncharacterized protein A4U43_C03F8540 [Asparagus officinalis]|uniref:Uncharacterized protein n=1 Tax=Asparagus officinalis TaxID=4686 RepID=A0A5P1FB56_ASPOF|nr:uncharacterized protein A4U43_C03F8540 [Asparagus officinalis]
MNPKAHISVKEMPRLPAPSSSESAQNQALNGEALNGEARRSSSSSAVEGHPLVGSDTGPSQKTTTRLPDFHFEGGASSSCSFVVGVGTKPSFERGSEEKFFELGRRGAFLVGVDDEPPEVDDRAI